MDAHVFKNALVVGGGQGIGLGFVKQLLGSSDTTHVYATYRRLESATELLAIEDSRLRVIQMDITDEAQIAQTIQQIQVESPMLHYIINSAGVLHEDEMQPEKSLRHINAEQLLRYFQVNSIGAMLLFKYAQPLLKHGDPRRLLPDGRLPGMHGVARGRHGAARLHDADQRRPAHRHAPPGLGPRRCVAS